MTTFSNSPRLHKAAVVAIDLLQPIPSVIIFQYNPRQVSRQLEARMAGQEGAQSEVLRLSGAPRETITLNEVALDATDQLEQGDENATSMGIYPQLSALEMLLYPRSSVVIANTILMAAGTIELIQPAAPFTLFIWGMRRVLPVRLSGLSITEERFDPDLNPIAATLSLTLTVLSYNDFPVSHPGYHTFLAHQVVKETMAALGSANNLNAVAGGDVDLF